MSKFKLYVKFAHLLRTLKENNHFSWLDTFFSY